MRRRSTLCARSAAAFALVVALLSAGACSKPPRHASLPAGSSVVALGDSLTYGTGATPETSYPSVLEQVSGWRIVNAGVPGETAAQGCARLPDLVAEHDPKLVMVLLGGNDFLRHLPQQGIVEALASCVSAARAPGREVVLLTVPRLGGNGLVDAPLYAEVAKANAVELLDSGLSTVLAQRSLRADFVHPNAEGYRKMATRIAEGLRELGYLRR